MPPVPEATDWYVIVPLPEESDISAQNQEFWGAAQVFVVHTDDMDVAAKIAHNHGYARCIVILGTHYLDPTVQPPDPPKGGP